MAQWDAKARNRCPPRAIAQARLGNKLPLCALHTFVARLRVLPLKISRLYHGAGHKTQSRTSLVACRRCATIETSKDSGKLNCWRKQRASGKSKDGLCKHGREEGLAWVAFSTKPRCSRQETPSSLSVSPGQLHNPLEQPHFRKIILEIFWENYQTTVIQLLTT